MTNKKMQKNIEKYNIEELHILHVALQRLWIEQNTKYTEIPKLEEIDKQVTDDHIPEMYDLIMQCYHKYKR